MHKFSYETAVNLSVGIQNQNWETALNFPGGQLEMIRTHSLINTNIFLIGNCLDTGAYQSLIMTGYIPGRPPSTHKQLHIITT